MLYFERGVASEEPGTEESKYRYHWGDALVRLGRKSGTGRKPDFHSLIFLKSVAESFEKEANDMFEAASQAGIFLSKFQRSTYNVDHLKGQPYWEPDELGLTIKEKVLRKSHVL